MTLYEALIMVGVEGAQEFRELAREDALLYAMNHNTRWNAQTGMAILPPPPELAFELLRALNTMTRAKREAERLAVEYANLSMVPLALIPGRHI